MVLLTKRHQFFDKNVKDFGRFIFRSGNAVRCFESQGVSIDSILAGELLEQEAPTSEKEMNACTSDRDRLLVLLQEYAAIGGFEAYDDWLRVGGALEHEGFSPEDWASLLWPNARDECFRKWDGLPLNLLTMGTLIYYAKKVDLNFLTNHMSGEEYLINSKLKAPEDDETT